MDVEAQLQLASPQPSEVGGEEIMMTTTQSQTNSNTNLPLPGPTDREVDHEAQPNVSRNEGVGENAIHEMDSGLSRSRVANDPPDDSGSPLGKHDVAPGPGGGGPEPRMMGDFDDFDDGANDLWTLYGKVANGHDEAQIQTMKEQMKDVFLFATLFSGALTAFVLDGKQSLKVNPADQTVYYLQQHSVLLAQISQQISSITPQVSIPSTPPPPYPTFVPSSSDLFVNSLWFMALVFSLMAALLALLIKQWVRDYMQVYQRYNDPLKRARLRQFLNDGWQRWNMPVLAGIGQQLLHISLFLFFWGLFVVVLNINTRVSIYTGIPVAFCTWFYTSAGCAPVIDPQSPYQSPTSGALWFYLQKVGGWRYYNSPDHDGEPRRLPVALNMAMGQMQLAMDKTEGRMGRDTRAIQWLVGRMTEDAEMDSLVQAIPNSLNKGWSLEVWKQVMCIPFAVRPPSLLPNAYQYSATTPLQEGDIGHELRIRVFHLLETCKTRSIFQNQEAWRLRTRACVETMVSLVFCANSDPELASQWFDNDINDIVKLLGDIGEVENEYEPSIGVIRWNLKRDDDVHKQTDLAIKLHADIAEGVSDLLPGQAQEGAQEIDESFKAVWRCLQTLYGGLHDGNLPQEQVSHILESEIWELERIHINADGLKRVDVEISRLQSCLSKVSHGIITQRLLGVQFDELHTGSIPFSQTIEWLQYHCFHQSTLLPGQHLESIWSLVPAFRSILNGKCDTYEEVLKNLKTFAEPEVPTWDGNVFQRQLWRLQDLHDSGGLGFAVELFFVALKRQFSASPRDSWLYIGTFQAITSDWRVCRRKRCLGTQKLLLDIVTSSNPSIMIYDSHYPDYITDEFLTLLENVLEQQMDEHHIDDAVQKLTDQLLPEHHTGTRRELFWAKALRVIAGARTFTS